MWSVVWSVCDRPNGCELHMTIFGNVAAFFFRNHLYLLLVACVYSIELLAFFSQVIYMVIDVFM